MDSSFSNKQICGASEQRALHNPADDKLSATEEDAWKYLNSVEAKLHNDREAFLEFLQLLIDCGEQRVTIPEVLTGVKKMFGEHRDLLEGFNMFLPAGLEISLLETMDFVKKVKARFEQYPFVYERFLWFLEQYESGMMTRQEVYKEVNVLFWGSTDLIMEFGEFFPNIQSKFPQQKS